MFFSSYNIVVLVESLKPLQAAAASLPTAAALSWAPSPQRAWTPCGLITGSQNTKETSANPFLVYHFIFSMFIFMQTNAIHLDFLLPLKA